MRYPRFAARPIVALLLGVAACSSATVDVRTDGSESAADPGAPGTTQSPANDGPTTTAGPAEDGAATITTLGPDDDGTAGPAGGPPVTEVVPDPGLNPADLGKVIRATATKVPDGDSFEVRIEGQTERVRMLGINTPEGDECLGDRAGDELRALILDREIDLVTIGSPDRPITRDDFDRILAYVFVDDRFVNHWLVNVGLAVARDQSGHSTATLLEETEAAAREAQVGLWSPEACGASAGAAISIAELQADAPGPDEENPNGEWVAFRNDGGEPVDLTGWTVRDESTRHRYSFPDGFVLGAGAEVVLRTGCGEDSATGLFWCVQNTTVWNNGGDTAILADPNGNIVASFAY